MLVTSWSLDRLRYNVVTDSLSTARQHDFLKFVVGRGDPAGFISPQGPRGVHSSMSPNMVTSPVSPSH